MSPKKVRESKVGGDFSLEKVVSRWDKLRVPGGLMATPPHKRHTVDENRCAGSTGERKTWSCFFQSAGGAKKVG